MHVWIQGLELLIYLEGISGSSKSQAGSKASPAAGSAAGPSTGSAGLTPAPDAEQKCIHKNPKSLISEIAFFCQSVRKAQRGITNAFASVA